MKFNKLNCISPPGQEQFVCFEYCAHSGGPDGIDVLFLGSATGRVYSYAIQKIAFARSLQPDDISRESPHGGAVTCLLFMRSRQWQPSAELGAPQSQVTSQTGDGEPSLIVSGGLDRSIKVWMSRSRNGSHYVQTLYGHDGKISCLADGHDGSFLSCASDGMLKIWSPQRGRHLMRLPFFECTFSMSSSSKCWLTSMLVNHIGVWTCIVGDSSGGLEVYRKSLQGQWGAEAKVATFNGAVLRFKRWEKIHSLGVVLIALAHDEKFVISLSSDGTAKIVDILLGAIFFSISNPRKCIYTGVLWIPSRMQFCLSDEVGQVELWSLLLERQINACSLVACPNKAIVKSIISTHRGPLLGSMTAHREPRNFLAILPRAGQVTLWKMEEETTCVEYLNEVSAETCMVVGFGVTPRPAASSGLLTHFSGVDGATGGQISGSGPIVGSISSILHAIHSSGSRKDVTFSSITSTVDKTGVQHEALLSDENSFFSVDQEGTCRCWDEYDKSERYTFRAKGTQVSCVKFVWGMNCLAVGHRNGLVSFWNLDSGLRFTSCKQLQTVSCMEIAKAKNCDVLIVTDFNGNIMMLNLSLFKTNPLQISIDATFQGYHAQDEPAILVLAFHKRTGVVFSGGDDRSICYWRLPKDIDFKTAGSHPGAVCCLATTEHLLVSGDEEGTINVWVIDECGGMSVAGAANDASGRITDTVHMQNDAYSYRRSNLPLLKLVGHWNLGSYAAIRSISAEEVFGGVYISFISRLNKTSVHFLCFEEKICTSQFVENSKNSAAEGGPDHSALLKADIVQMVDSGLPGSGPTPPLLKTASGPARPVPSKRLVRRSSAAAMQPSNEQIDVTATQDTVSINWQGISSDSVMSTGNECSGDFKDADDDSNDADMAGRSFFTTRAYSYVECTDIDEFHSPGLGKEPTCVLVQYDESKNVCFNYVGTENGSIYKYTSSLAGLG